MAWPKESRFFQDINRKTKHYTSFVLDYHHQARKFLRLERHQHLNKFKIKTPRTENFPIPNP